MEKLTELRAISTSIQEGRLLMAAMAILTTTVYSNKTPDEVMGILNETADKMEDK